MELTPTWDALRELWFKNKVFAGPSEKFDAGQGWDHFVRGWETDRSDLKTLQETYRNFGARYETLRAEVERLREDVTAWQMHAERAAQSEDAARTEAATLRAVLAAEIEGLDPFPLMGRTARSGYRLALRRAASAIRQSGVEKT